MRDKRPVDDLSLDELEQLLLVRRRQARAERLRRLGRGQSESDWLDTLDEDEARPLPQRLAQPASALPPASEPIAAPRRRRLNLTWVRDSALLILEVLALVGLIAILVASVFNLQTLNQEVALAREATPVPTAAAVVAAGTPSPTPQPQIRMSVLPGGHSPPESAGAVPQRLSDLVQPVVPVPIPTQGPRSATRIVIPSINVDAAVVEGDDWEQLKKGAAHHIGTANPGERGNVFISAHNDIFGAWFRYLDKVELQDQITLYAGDTPYRYIVKAKRIVEPTDVSVMAATASPVLTLMTCYPYMIDTHRLVVIAELAD